MVLALAYDRTKMQFPWQHVKHDTARAFPLQWNLLNLQIPCFFWDNATGFSIQNRLSARCFLDLTLSARFIQFSWTLQPFGPVAISSKITSNHQGIGGYISCMCQNNTQLTKSWSCHKHRDLCKPGPSKILHLCNHRLQCISLEHLWDHRLGPMASDGLCISSSLVTLNSRNEFWNVELNDCQWIRRRG